MGRGRGKVELPFNGSHSRLPSPKIRSADKAVQTASDAVLREC